MRQSVILTLLLTEIWCLLHDEELHPALTFEVPDGLFKNVDIKRWFGHDHLSRNKQSKTVKSATPIIWGESDQVVVMLEVKAGKKNCTASRNVVFLLNTGAPYTVISPALKQLILKDCRLQETTHGKMDVRINGRRIEARSARDYHHGTNVLGMDYMKANNVEFNMKINRHYRDKSILELKFDTRWEEEL